MQGFTAVRGGPSRGSRRLRSPFRRARGMTSVARRADRNHEGYWNGLDQIRMGVESGSLHRRSNAAWTTSSVFRLVDARWT